MKLARCARNGAIFWAVVDTAAGTVRPISGTPADWGPALTEGAGEKALTFIGSTHSLAEVTLLPPIEATAQVFVVGANYLKHLQELKMEPPKSPIAFLKSNRALIGAKDDIWHAPLTKQLDYEVEMVAVIGKPLAKGQDVTQSVLGYTVGNDVSARDLQRSGIGFDLALPDELTFTVQHTHCDFFTGDIKVNDFSHGSLRSGLIGRKLFRRLTTEHPTSHMPPGGGRG